MTRSNLSSLERAKFRVKIKSLAYEARIIRHEEARACRSVRRCIDRKLAEALAAALEAHHSLHEHRAGVLRREARSAHLAYAFARGVPYAAVERRAAKSADVQRIAEIIKSLTRRSVPLDDIASWLSASLVS